MIDNAARGPGGEAQEKSQQGRKAAATIGGPEQSEVGRWDVEGLEDPVGADGEVAGAPGQSAPEGAERRWGAACHSQT